jgi:hypothetical protein
MTSDHSSATAESVAAQPTPRDSNHLTGNDFYGFLLNPPSEIKLGKSWGDVEKIYYIMTLRTFQLQRMTAALLLRDDSVGFLAESI